MNLNCVASGKLVGRVEPEPDGLEMSYNGAESYNNNNNNNSPHTYSLACPRRKLHTERAIPSLLLMMDAREYCIVVDKRWFDLDLRKLTHGLSGRYVGIYLCWSHCRIKFLMPLDDEKCRQISWTWTWTLRWGLFSFRIIIAGINFLALISW